MSALLVRRLLIDLKQPFPARWNGGDAFRSAFYSALSMGFPVGERYFIDSVCNGVKALQESERKRFSEVVRGFAGQEAMHRRIHTLFNNHLTRLGYRNHIERWASQRIKSNLHGNPCGHVASTAAIEHIFAIVADWTLRHPAALEGAEPRLQLLWQWHCAEECEHRATTFDIYTAMGGSYEWRVRIFRYVSRLFILDVLRQTICNLWHDRSLFKWSTWQSCVKFFFARGGMVRECCRAWRDYMSHDFHPDQHDVSASRQWLLENEKLFSVGSSESKLAA